MELYSHQKKAISELHNGSILCGSVGSGKSRTALAYYVEKVCGGDIYDPKELTSPRDLYIITTAKKRDSLEWEDECGFFRIFPDQGLSLSGVKLTIDSWNNIKKYKDVYGAFFIFDEQRLVGSGAWVKAFLKIACKNKWILLTATPADSWQDYCAVFVANGFFKNKTEFVRKHVVYSAFSKYPKIDRYVDQGPLIRYRNQILVKMDFTHLAKRDERTILVGYDKLMYKTIWKERWNPFDDEPIRETGKLMYLIRRVVNSDLSRVVALTELLESNPKVIIFYNFTYELEIMRDLLTRMCIPFSEWNGQKHEEILDGDNWVYLVQYNAGAEGWNCITTNVVIFYSLNYSYKMTEQAKGRIDRMNTPFTELQYYILRSNAPIDVAINRALKNKENFNERSFLGK